VRTIIKYLQRDARNKLTYKVKKNRSIERHAYVSLAPSECDAPPVSLRWMQYNLRTSSNMYQHTETRTWWNANNNWVRPRQHYNHWEPGDRSVKKICTPLRAQCKLLLAYDVRPTHLKFACCPQSKTQNQIHAVLRLIIWALKTIMAATCNITLLNR
jgi:hypothetical protein